MPLPPRTFLDIPLRNWAAACTAVAIIPTGFLFGSWVHETTHEEVMAKAKLAEQDCINEQQEQQEQKSTLAAGLTAAEIKEARDKKEEEQRVWRVTKAQELAALDREMRRAHLQMELDEIKGKMKGVKNRGWKSAQAEQSS